MILSFDTIKSNNFIRFFNPIVALMPCKSSLQTRTSKAIIEIQISDIYNIKAPSYVLYPEITEATQIENAMKTYNVKPIKENEH